MVPMSSPSPTRRIGLLGFEAVTALDLVGPMDVFAAANALRAERQQGITMRPAYELLVIGVNRRAFRAESGLLMQPHCSLADISSLDTLLIPGGAGLREARCLKRVSHWLATHHRAIRRVASVCTGIYALAEAGLLDNCRVTTHWRYADALAQRYPRLQVEADSIFIKQGRCYTSAGITAGIDLALALVEEDHGPRLALSVARELVVYLKRSGGQRQFSERLGFQTRTPGRLSELVGWMRENLAADLSLESLAQRCRLGPRQLARRFRLELDATPAAFVEVMRIEEAAHSLLACKASIESVAESVGFRSADVFRRAFERRYGLNPGLFRERFSGMRFPHA